MEKDLEKHLKAAAREELKRLKKHAAEQAYMIEASVYRNAHGYDCTNSGASSRFTTLYIYASRVMIPAALLDAEQRNLNIAQCFRVGLVKVGDTTHYHVKPLDPALAGKWQMFGGNFVFINDSRWQDVTKIDYPLPVHDRIEEYEG